MRRPVALLAALSLHWACSDGRSPSGGLPTAQLEVTSEAVLGARVRIDASGSHDPEGKQLRYRFDFNDGSPSVVTGAAITHHVFRARGLFPVCVWVTDVDGLTASQCREVTVVIAPDAGSPDAPRDGGSDQSRDGQPKDFAADQPKPDLFKPDQVKLDKSPPDQPKPDLPKADLPKADLPKPDLPKADLPKPDLPKPDLPKADLPKPDLPKPDLPKPDLSPTDVGPDQNTCFSPEAGGTGAAGYTIKTVPACHPALGSAGTKLGINKDEAGVLTILPFSFSYFGKSALAAGVSANGYIQLVGSNPLALLEPVPVVIPSSTNPNNTIAAFWDNLAPISTGSDVWVATLGQAPKRVYVIEWQAWTFSNYASPAEVAFSILLYEGSNVVELQYSKLDGGARSTGSAASIGIENESGTLGLQHAFKKAGAVSTSQGIRFVPN